MKVRILENCDHRISSGISQHFTAGSTVSVPRGVGDALVIRGVAEAVDGGRQMKPAIEEK